MGTNGTARISALVALLGAFLGFTVVPASSAVAQPLKAMWGPTVEHGVSQFPTYSDLGVQLLETRISWATTAARRPAHPRDPNDPAYSWPADVGTDIASSAAVGIKVSVQLIGAPRWANGGRSAVWAPTRPSDFADFAYAASRRYPTVRLWMIWGEPTRHQDFEPIVAAKPGAKLDRAQQAAPQRYAEILDAAYGTLKRANPRNLVIGGMSYTTGDIDTQQWIRNMRLRNGRPPRLDLYGHNPFTSRDPSEQNPTLPLGIVDISELRLLTGWIDRYLGRGRPQIELFLSEWTLPTAVDDEFNFFVSPAIQAQWIADAWRLVRRSSRVYAFGWIHLYDNLPTTGGGLFDSRGAKKPGYFAWKGG